MKPTCVGPQVTTSTRLTVPLLVDEGQRGTARRDVDAPPVWTLAVASPALLWAPDHTPQQVTMTGGTDPDDQNITLTVTHVTQDEPVGCPSHHGDRDDDADDDASRACRHTTPDAIIQPHGQVMLRVERRGHGHGRVSQISCLADDGRGGKRTGHVSVCVPHDRHDTGCSDEGQQYDATKPSRG